MTACVALTLLALCLPTYAAEAPLDAKQSSIKFTGHATLHDFEGQAPDVRGSAQIDRANPNLVTSAVVEVGTSRMTTQEDSRDRNMHTWLHADANPGIEFRLTKITSTAGNPATATSTRPARFAVRGDFTLNHVTRTLTTAVTGWREGGLLVVSGAMKIDTTVYDLPVIEQFFLTVDKNVDVTFRLAFDLPPKR